MEDENLNIEGDNYRFELKEGRYREMTKINENNSNSEANGANSNQEN